MKCYIGNMPKFNKMGQFSLTVSKPDQVNFPFELWMTSSQGQSYNTSS